MENQKLKYAEELVLHTDSHIFLTGKAGTGKTTFLRSLKSKTYKRMVIVAPTGVAAINAEGVTIHSFFQLPLGPQTPGQPINYQKLNKKKLQIIRTLDLLVIDEISMVRADLLDAIDNELRRVRRCDRAFGGVQVLMIGDIHQLAPVAKPEEWELLQPYYDSVYFFSSHVLKETPYLCIELEHIYRQQDPNFIELLNKIRNGRLDQQSMDLLQKRCIPNFNPEDKEGYITLTTHNAQADSINETKLDALKTQRLTFRARTEGTFPENTYPTKENLELKIGAQVMFVKNDPSPDKQFFNGKIGRIVRYDQEEQTLYVESGGETIPVTSLTWQNFEYTLDKDSGEIKEKEIGTFEQMPLRLAWAITIHKSQGLTFDKLIVDAGKAFAHGQVYVALSRCTSLKGLVLKTPINPYNLLGDTMVDQYVNHIPEIEPTTEKVSELEHVYELTLMLELIDFNILSADTAKLMKIIVNNASLYRPDFVTDLTNRRQRLKMEVIEVATKFGNQIKALHAQCDSVSENKILQERLQKGIIYFIDKLQEIFDDVDTLPFKTDNKEVNSQIEEVLTIFFEDLQVKKACLKACQDKFSVEKYLATRSSAQFEAEKGSQQGKKLKDSTSYSKARPLLKALISWRTMKAKKFGINTAGIAPFKTLEEIDRLQPSTKKELRQIAGMGALRVKKYGEEILGIVAKYSGQQHIIERDIEIEEETRKVSTYEITRKMLDDGMSPEDIAKARNFVVGTIYDHIAKFVKEGLYDADEVIDADTVFVIKDYFAETEDPSINAARVTLGDEYSYGEIKIVLAELMREGFFKA